MAAGGEQVESRWSTGFRTRFEYQSYKDCISYIIIIIMIMSVFLERFSMCNMLNCAEQVQIQK